VFGPFIDRAVALVVPPRCAACAAAVAPGVWICASCRGALLALPVGRDDGKDFAAFPYAGPARPLIAALKFRGATAVSGELAELMRPRLPPWFAAADCLVPVPAHPTRRRERGYNQSLLLARALARASDTPVIDCLRRAPLSAPQSQLSRAQRLTLPRNAITLDRGALRQAGVDSLTEFPTNVVVCDDVVTTGVTLGACAQVIRDWHDPAGSVLVRSVSFAGAG
jgi:ComF family protein